MSGDLVSENFFEQNPDADVKIINVAPPEYGGMRNEGWFAAIRAVLEQTELNGEPNDKINVIAPMISPADMRYLKNTLKSFFPWKGTEFAILPDNSENLDGATDKRYNSPMMEGASIECVAEMAGARMTIEFSEFTDSQNSPAEYLAEAFGIPFVKLPLPVGVRGMDTLAAALVDAGGRVNPGLMKARGRCLDAMADARKHCAEARAAVCGDPDFTVAMVRLCCENGILPVVAVTGSVTPKLRGTLTKEAAECAEYHFEKNVAVLDDTDFAAIEDVCRKRGANLLIGSSDGRRIARSMGIPLIRCAFPIHDYVGGQRVRILGFDGTLNILDQAANAMIERTESTFSSPLYAAADVDKANVVNTDTVSTNIVNTDERTASHPCFGEHACQNVRVHLPVAPECNIQCNYCLRNYDCMNESRPGVASKILSPKEAFDRYVKLKETMPNLTVAAIAGPGDALANFNLTSETFRLIREYDKDVTFCIATNGLLLPQYVSQLRELGVSHVTVTVNAVDPAVGAKIYHRVSYMGKAYEGAEGASILLANQLAGIKMLADAGIICKVNSVTLKGINDKHIPDVVKTVAELGVFMANVMPHIPVKGSAFEGLDRVTNYEIAELRDDCGAFVKQMPHCRQCRSDAAGTLDDDRSIDFYDGGEVKTASPSGKRMRFAVATKNGAIVDMHFGHASEFYIYESDAANTRFVETRRVDKYCNGPDCNGKEDKWEPIIRAVADCAAVLAMRIGPTPEKRLKENGIDTIMTYDRVETAVARAAKERSAVR